MTQQKVITITSNTDTGSGEIRNVEYPELNKYLEDGYLVKDKIILTPPNAKSHYACVFILEKRKKNTVRIS